MAVWLFDTLHNMSGLIFTNFHFDIPSFGAFPFLFHFKIGCVQHALTELALPICPVKQSLKIHI